MPPGSTPQEGREGVETIATLREREGLKELVLPGGMGDAFRVLVLGVGDVPRDLAGLSRPWTRDRETAATAPLSPPRGTLTADEQED